RLDLSGGFPGEWVHLTDSSLHNDAILALGRGPAGDTLVATTGGSTGRSVDGGHTWEQVHNRGRDGLYEIPAGLPHAGRILVSASDGFARAVAYSDDRGATFTEGVMPDDGE